MPQADLDALLQSEDSASEDSQSQEQNSDDQSQTEEEIAFNTLSGSAQDRIRGLLRRTKDAEAEAERMKALAYSGGAKLPPVPPESNSDVQSAIKKLDDVGMATKDYVQEQMNKALQSIQYEQKMKQLSESESGQDGRPKFDRYEYEDFVKTHPQYRYYDPADVFSIMYRDELLDWELKNREIDTSTPSLKSSRTVSREDVWTPEYIEQNIKEQGTAWYEKNLDKINKVLGAMR